MHWLSFVMSENELRYPGRTKVLRNKHQQEWRLHARRHPITH
ncbi:hypothetical protein [Panacagrimonas sp.]